MLLTLIYTSISMLFVSNVLASQGQNSSMDSVYKDAQNFALANKVENKGNQQQNSQPSLTLKESEMKRVQAQAQAFAKENLVRQREDAEMKRVQEKAKVFAKANLEQQTNNVAMNQAYKDAQNFAITKVEEHKNSNKCQALKFIDPDESDDLSLPSCDKTAKNQTIKNPNNDELIVFVSFSMPQISLKKLRLQAALINDKGLIKVRLIMRGLIENSFKKTASALHPVDWTELSSK